MEISTDKAQILLESPNRYKTEVSFLITPLLLSVNHVVVL